MEKTMVIKDEQDNFVNRMGLGIIDNEWYYSRSTGLTSGVIFYSNPERAEFICNNFQSISNRYNFGKTFSLESVNIDDMPEGKTVCDKIVAVNQERKSYFIKDNFGCFSGSLGLSVKNMDGTGLEWLYVASKNADSCHANKDLAIAEIERLKELNEIAGIEGLTWELVYTNRKEFPYIEREDKLPNLLILNNDVPVGCIGKHKKAEKDIRKKYKPIFAEFNTKIKRK